jgi:hypothetical protein
VRCAAGGARRRRRQARRRVDPLTASAAEAGAGELVREWIAGSPGRASPSALADLIALIALVDRIAAGHVVALPANADDAHVGDIDVFEVPAIDRLAAQCRGRVRARPRRIESLDDARAREPCACSIVPSITASATGRLRWSIDGRAHRHAGDGRRGRGRAGADRSQPAEVLSSRSPAGSTRRSMPTGASCSPGGCAARSRSPARCSSGAGVPRGLVARVEEPPTKIFSCAPRRAGPECCRTRRAAPAARARRSPRRRMRAA